MEFSVIYRIVLAVLNIIANLIILAIGLCVLAIGIAGAVLVNIQLNASQFIVFFNTAFGLVIGIGVLITTVSVISIIGSFTSFCPKNKALKWATLSLLAIAIVGMTVILLCELAVVILTIIFQSNIRPTFNSGLLAFFNDTLTNNPNSVEEIIVTIQVTFRCCGANGPADYANIPAIGNTTALPGGCCLTNHSCTLSDDPSEYIGVGCGNILQDVILAYSFVMIGLGVVILILSISVIVMPLLIFIFIVKKSDGLKVV